MRMNADQINSYTDFARYVRTGLPTVVSQRKIIKAIEDHSGATGAVIKRGLTWHDGPLVNVKALIPHQCGNHVCTPTGGYTLGTNTIDVSMADVGRFQTGQDMRATPHGHVHLITVILLHELTHWAREQSRTKETPGVEDGFEFEKEAYGTIIQR
jgi:Metallopeptidase toxin 3